MTSMPSKLESTPKTYPDLVLRNAENLVRTGLSQDEVGDILDEIEEWLSSGTHFAPDIPAPFAAFPDGQFRLSHHGEG
jgi:hypothetical protein